VDESEEGMYGGYCEDEGRAEEKEEGRQVRLIWLRRIKHLRKGGWRMDRTEQEYY
jgi:hypothetical protein